MGWLWKRGETREHAYAEARLSAYLDGELSPQERERVDRHLAVCADCRWNLDTLRQTVQWTRDLPAVPLPRAFTLPASVQPARQQRRQRRWGAAPLLQGATALVALLLVLVVAGDFLLLGSLGTLARPQAVKMEAPPEWTAEVRAGAVPPTVVAAEMPLVKEGEVVATPPPPEHPLAVTGSPAVGESAKEGGQPAPAAPRTLGGPSPIPTPALAAPTPAAPSPTAGEPQADAGAERAAGESLPPPVPTRAPSAVNPLRLVELGLGLAFVTLAALTIVVTLRRR